MHLGSLPYTSIFYRGLMTITYTVVIKFQYYNVIVKLSDKNCSLFTSIFSQALHLCFYGRLALLSHVLPYLLTFCSQYNLIPSYMSNNYPLPSRLDLTPKSAGYGLYRTSSFDTFSNHEVSSRFGSTTFQRLPVFFPAEMV